jgi:hypothetical protein
MEPEGSLPCLQKPAPLVPILSHFNRGQPMRSGPQGWGFGEGLTTRNHEKEACYEVLPMGMDVRGCVQNFPDWPPGARTANGTALCH